jgi:hypothetical protein
LEGVESNPLIHEKNRIALLRVKLVLSSLGKKIL